jgi:hypothetical protein
VAPLRRCPRGTTRARKATSPVYRGPRGKSALEKERGGAPAYGCTVVGAPNWANSAFTFASSPTTTTVCVADG